MPPIPWCGSLGVSGSLGLMAFGCFLQRFSRFGTSDALGGPRVSLLGSFDGSWQVLGKFLARPWQMPGTFLTGSWVSSALEVSGFMEPKELPSSSMVPAPSRALGDSAGG
jgi:hypothetical protein